MAKQRKLVEPRQFILNQRYPNIQAEVRAWILCQSFPPEWGASSESEISRSLAHQGFSNVRCRCLDTHRVAVIRMGCDNDPVNDVRRLLRRAIRELGFVIPKGGFNCAVRRDRVKAELVLL